MFDGVPAYRGTGYRFTRHFFTDVPAFDGKDGGEEFKAAQIIDSMAEIDFWVRNVAGHPNAFWLPVAGASSNRTYPDFVAKLKNGRILVVEYKGGHLVADAAEKRLVGELWAATSKGRGVYVLAEKTRDGMDVRGQIRKALELAGPVPV
jgi:type III restriction enzyme